MSLTNEVVDVFLRVTRHGEHRNSAQALQQKQGGRSAPHRHRIAYPSVQRGTPHFQEVVSASTLRVGHRLI